MEPTQLRSAHDLELAFEAWNEVLYRYTYLRLRNREACQDVVQEAFIKAWKSRDSFDDSKASLKTWIFRILSNTIIDHLRKLQRRPQAELAETLPSEQQLDEEAAQADQIRYVMNKVSTLTDRDQDLILLRYREGLSMAEIAQICDLSETATKVAIHRAIKKLREKCENDVTEETHQRIHD